MTPSYVITKEGRRGPVREGLLLRITYHGSTYRSVRDSRTGFPRPVVTRRYFVYLGPAGLECCWDRPPSPAWPRAAVTRRSDLKGCSSLGPEKIQGKPRAPTVNRGLRGGASAPFG